MIKIKYNLFGRYIFIFIEMKNDTVIKQVNKSNNKYLERYVKNLYEL